MFTVLKENFNKELLAIGIYGSIARNSAKLGIDLDIWLVFKTQKDLRQKITKGAQKTKKTVSKTFKERQK